jgi:hypothetical protein
MVGCAGLRDFDSCASCFAQRDPDGYLAFATHLLFDCGCKTTGGGGGAGGASTGMGGAADGGAGGASTGEAPCLAECDTTDPATDMCGESGMVDLDVMTPGACVACVNALMRGEECLTAFQMDCGSDAKCVEYVGALQTCPAP